MSNYCGVDILPKRGAYSGKMSTQDARKRLELLQGTPDLVILRTLIFGSQHGQGIARAIQDTSGKEQLVEHMALCPALQRPEDAGRKRLVQETNEWKRLTGAIVRVLGPEGAEG